MYACDNGHQNVVATLLSDDVRRCGLEYRDLKVYPLLAGTAFLLTCVLDQFQETVRMCTVQASAQCTLQHNVTPGHTEQ